LKGEGDGTYELALAAADLRSFVKLPNGEGDDKDAVTTAAADTE